MMKRARSRCQTPATAAVVAVAWGMSGWACTPVDAAAQAPEAPCETGPITSIFVDNRSIFEEDTTREGRLGWAYGLANSLHVRTRESFIMRELLFEEGDCYDPLLLEESGRVLRDYGFIATADVFGVPQGDGTWHVVVDTQDEWTTKVDLGATFDDGFEFEKAEIQEENLLGRGILASVFYRSRREQEDLGAALQLPRVLGSRADARIAVGQTRAGSFVDEELSYPFVGDVGRVAVRQVFRRRDELFPYVVRSGGRDADVPMTHLLLPLLDERIELSLAGRLGRPGNLTVIGLGVSRETLDFGGFPGTAELALDGEFGETQPAPGVLEEIVAGQTRTAATTRVNLMIGQRNLRYERVRGLDALDGLQDVRLGSEVGLTLGRAVDVLSSDELSSSDDLYTRLRLFLGHEHGRTYLFANVALEARQIFSGGVSGDGWRDVVSEVDLLGYLRFPGNYSHTLFARAAGAGSWGMDTPFQLTLGGRAALRGYDLADFPGGRRVLLTLEDRILLRWPAPDLFDLGLTLFGEAGRMWDGDVPFGVDSGWRGTVGAGLRFGFPAGSRGVVRLDLAFPVGSDVSRGPVFRVGLFELLGLSGGFLDPQVERSRRITVGPDYFDQTGR